MIPGKSLSFRLIVGAAGWTIGALLAGALLISNLLGDYVTRNFDARLAAQLDGLIGATVIGKDGKPKVTRLPSDPLYRKPYSGHYWQISDGRGEPLTSESLFDLDLKISPNDMPTPIHKGYADGPDGQRLRILVAHVKLGDSGRIVAFAVAADLAEVEQETHRFNVALAWSLSALGFGLILAVFIQVRFGLRPLRRIGRALADIRGGRAESMAGDYPDEVLPLVDELNKLLAHNAQVVERARTHVGNLAHALKTPLSVLTNEAAAGRPSAETVAQQTRVMRRHVDHYLIRARTAATGDVLRARTPVRAVAEDLARTLARIHIESGVEILVRGGAYLAFRGERQDLEEMLGNLMDNACKWADSTACVRIGAESGQLRVTVEDDGPGLPKEARDAALQRGERLDEAVVPGTGLGLAIVRDIAGLCGGSVTLGDSDLGGLLVTLMLPAAAYEEDAPPDDEPDDAPDSSETPG